MPKKRTTPFKVELKGRKRFLRLLGSPGKGVNLRAGLVNLTPKEAVGEHITDQKEEAIFIIRGTAKVYYGRKVSFIARAKSFIYIPPDTRHDIENIGKSRLEYIYITSPIE